MLGRSRSAGHLPRWWLADPVRGRCQAHRLAPVAGKGATSVTAHAEEPQLHTSQWGTGQPPTEWMPVPDPTKLTTEQLRRELGALREIIETRLDGMDRATELASEQAAVVRAEIEQIRGRLREETAAEVARLRELLETRLDGMDRAIAIQFTERDARHRAGRGHPRAPSWPSTRRCSPRRNSSPSRTRPTPPPPRKPKPASRSRSTRSARSSRRRRRPWTRGSPNLRNASTAGKARPRARQGPAPSGALTPARSSRHSPSSPP